MNACDSEDEDEEIEKVGRKFKVNLNDLQSANSKALTFLYKVRESDKKKNKAKGIIKSKLEKSTENIMKISPPR